MPVFNILELNEKLITELRLIAKTIGIRRPDAYKKEELIYKILDEQAIIESKAKSNAMESSSYVSEKVNNDSDIKKESFKKNKTKSQAPKVAKTIITPENGIDTVYFD